MLCHGEQKANSHKCGENGLKMFVVVIVAKLKTRSTKSVYLWPYGQFYTTKNWNGIATFLKELC